MDKMSRSEMIDLYNLDNGDRNDLPDPIECPECGAETLSPPCWQCGYKGEVE